MPATYVRKKAVEGTAVLNIGLTGIRIEVFGTAATFGEGDCSGGVTGRPASHLTESLFLAEHALERRGDVGGKHHELRIV